MINFKIHYSRKLSVFVHQQHVVELYENFLGCIWQMEVYGCRHQFEQLLRNC